MKTYTCDDCGKRINGPNLVIMGLGLERYEKMLCDDCAEMKVGLFKSGGQVKKDNYGKPEDDKLKVYEVGIMSDKRKVIAPSPESAALFYGLNTNGNMTLGAVVYSVDGQEQVQNQMPWARWAFNTNPTKQDEKVLRIELDRVKPQLERCKFM